MKIFLIISLFITLTACNYEAPGTMSFVALGDAPNNKNEYQLYESLIKNINAAKPSLVVHLGDTHGRSVCSNKEIDRMRRYMNDFIAPVLYTPGDNDWTDCGRARDGKFDSIERLNYLRKTYYQEEMTLGAVSLSVHNQNKDGYPENMRFIKSNIGFITVHVVGSNNNLDTLDLDRIKEYYDRNAANLAWLKESFAALNKADAIVVALHANMFERKFDSFRKIFSKINDDKMLLLSLKTYGKLSYRVFKLESRLALPYRNIGKALLNYSSELKKPILLLHGDTHDHRTYQPFKKKFPYFHAIEVYGAPDVKAIEITVQPKSKRPFQVVRVFSP